MHKIVTDRDVALWHPHVYQADLKASILLSWLLEGGNTEVYTHPQLSFLLVRANTVVNHIVITTDFKFCIKTELEIKVEIVFYLSIYDCID